MTTTTESMSPCLNIAMVQVQSVYGDKNGNLERMENAITRESANSTDVKIDLFVFAELSLTGYRPYDCQNDIQASELAEYKNGPSFQRFSTVCSNNNCGMVYGFIEKCETTKSLYISSMFIDRDGSCLACVRKTHLWIFSEFERHNFSVGDHLSPIVEFSGVRIGLLICFDLEVVEPSRTLKLKGADLLICIGANTSKFTLTHTSAVRAFENQIHLIYVNQIGNGFVGHSAAYTPDGQLMKEDDGKGVLSDTEDVGVIKVQPKLLKWADSEKRNPLIAVRRPELYK